MSNPSPVRKMKAQQSKEVVDEDEWPGIDEYKIIQWNVVGNSVINGRPVSLVLDSGVDDVSKDGCPMRFSCRCSAGIWITKKGRRSRLKRSVCTIRIHDSHSSHCCCCSTCEAARIVIGCRWTPSASSIQHTSGKHPESCSI
jgi:hypothetical protein